MIYLDNAATTFPKPEEVYNEIMNCMRNYNCNSGRGYYDMSAKVEKKILETRFLVAKLFSIKDPFNVVFTCNATEGLNIGIKGLLKVKNHAIATVMEHNSVLRPLKTLNKKGIQVTLVGVDKSGKVNIKDIKKEIKKNTKAIIINHASNVTGTVQNIEAIGSLAREHGITFILDASQSAGYIPIDVDKCNVDIMALSGHKALYGPQGTGIIYIREGICLENFKDGGTGNDSQSMIQPDALPYKYESGTLNIPGIVGLGEGIKFINKIGIDTVKKHTNDLIYYLQEELSKLNYVRLYCNDNKTERCPILSFNIEGLDSTAAGHLLNREGIAVRTGYHCAPLIHGILGTYSTGTVRISLSYFNTFEQIEKTIEAVKKVYKSH
jgi:cysteine desulfurase family protein